MRALQASAAKGNQPDLICSLLGTIVPHQSSLLPLDIKPHKDLLAHGKGQTPIGVPIPGYSHPSRQPLSIAACCEFSPLSHNIGRSLRRR